MLKLEHCNPLIAKRVIRNSYLTALLQHPVGQ